MQIKVYSIPIIGGEKLNEELNVFLRSKKILHVENQLITHAEGMFWCFCIKYLEDGLSYEKDRVKIDYKQVLDEESFARFSKFREIRKKISNEEDVPAYAIFTDEELAGLAKLSELSLASMKTVKGVGEKKIEKYGKALLDLFPK